MRNWLLGYAAALTAVLGLTLIMRAHAGQSAQATKSADTQRSEMRDFSGVWDPAPYMQPKGEVNPLDLSGHPSPLPPFTAWGKEKYEANAKFIGAGAVLDCDPFGVSRNYFTPRPFEIIQARDRLVQHFEYYDNWREIWTDGRKFPADLEPDYMGYSIARWEGDTFVVDSTGYNGKQFLTWQGYPITESLHQTERWQRVAPDTLKIFFTFEDPKAYSQPWSITFFYKLKKDWVLDAHPCTLSAIKEYDDKLNHRDNLPGGDYKPQN